MLSEFNELEAHDPSQMARVTKIIGHLLRHQFVHAEDKGSPALLETLHRPALARLVTDYFDVAGYRLVIRETEGWAGIVPDIERITPPRLKISETLVLLILRRLWEESIQAGDILKHGSVLLTLNEAYDAYQDTVARARRPSLSIIDFRANIKDLERRALVHLGPYDDEAQDMELTIRALIAVVTGDDFLVNLEQLLSKSDLAESADRDAVEDEQTP
jgi:hypothetical protein